MGAPTKPNDAAPSYEELFSGHPSNSTNQQSSGPYTTVPQVDIEEHDHVEHDGDEESLPLHSTTIIDGTKPHVHCETCDQRLERREKRRAAKHCCQMVGATFMVAIVCMMMLGIVIARANAK
ncbi:hypothetical protein FQN54_005490 [Arachnomyces sp. PD_36]|nr:hypothetical protein FQN54_005490 [Arachnomyces sp. PD_36]